MRTLLIFFGSLSFLMLSFSKGFSQAPDAINYQAVARDVNGNILAGQSLNVRMSVYSGSTLVWEEEHTGVTTNDFGLFTVKVGTGNQTGGSLASFSNVSWGSADHFLQVEIDPGSGYEDLGTKRFESVPYALFAKSSGSGGGGGTLQSAYTGGNSISLDTNGPLFVQNSGDTLFYANGPNVGMGTNSPYSGSKLDVRYVGSGGPGILTASSPFPIPTSTFSGPLSTINSGLFSVGVGSQRAIGVTGYSLVDGNIPSATDSAYGVTGVSIAQNGGCCAVVGVSGVSQVKSDIQQAVGVYGRVEDEAGVNYTSPTTLAGGFFEAAIYQPVDTTVGVVGAGGNGGNTNIGMVGFGGGSNTTIGVLALAGNGTNNIGLVATGGGGSNDVAGYFVNGDLVAADSLGVGIAIPQFRNHIEGRTYSSEGFLTDDTAEYRYNAPKTHYYSISPSDFQAADTSSYLSDFQLHDKGRTAGFGSSNAGLNGTIVAPIHLPDGAVITEVTYYYNDVVSSDLNMMVERVPYSASSFSTTMSGSQVNPAVNSGANSSISQVTGQNLVDNSQYYYQVRVDLEKGFGDGLAISGVKIQYQVLKAD